MEVLINNGTFFDELIRRVNYQNEAKMTRLFSIANTYKNEPQFQKVLNLSHNYMRVGNQKFKDPFLIKSRPYYNDYNGRNLNMLNTLKNNANKDKPDIITLNPLKVSGFY